MFRNGESCDAFEYPLGDGELSGTRVAVRGRYPQRGWAVNRECKELGYVLRGRGRLIAEETATEFGPGDVLLVERGERYFWSGRFEAFLCSAPAWRAGQYEINE